MTVALFGASGFIGKHVASELRAQDVKFRPFSRRAIGSEPGIEFSDPATYRELLRDVRCAVLLVSQTSPATRDNSMLLEMTTNVLPHTRFVDVVIQSEIAHVVYVSSGGTVYGEQRTHGPIKEDHPTSPVGFYGAGKLIVETVLKTGLSRAGRSWTILRAGNPVGTGQGEAVGLVSRAVNCAINREPIDIWGDGSVVRDFFDVGDLVRAIIAVIDAPRAANEIFNVGSGTGTSIDGVIELVGRAAGSPLEVIRHAARPADVRRNVLSPVKLKRTLGIAIGTSLADTVAKLLDDQASRLV